MSDGPFATGTYPGDLTADDGGPRRGSLKDFGGATIIDVNPKPDKDTMLYADLCNGLQRTAAAHEKAVFMIGISVTFTAGTPNAVQMTGPSEAAILGTLTDVDDNGTGDTTIHWPADTFPAPILGPMVSLNDGTVGGGATAQLVVNGVRVKTWTGANTPADRPFTVTVM